MQPGLANTQPYSMRNLLQRSYVWNIYVHCAARSKKCANKERKKFVDATPPGVIGKSEDMAFSLCDSLLSRSHLTCVSHATPKCRHFESFPCHCRLPTLRYNPQIIPCFVGLMPSKAEEHSSKSIEKRSF